MLPIHAKTFTATASAAGLEGYAFQFDGALTIQPWDDASQPPVGIALAVDPFVPTKVDVARSGDRVWAVAGAAISPASGHRLLTTDGNGKLQPAAAGEYYVAELDAVDFAVGDGDLVEVTVSIGIVDSDN